MTKLAKQKAILVDIHHTLLNEDDELNKDLINLMLAISKEYYVCIYTAAHYFNERDAKAQLSDIGADYIYYNHNVRDLNDVTVKSNIYKKDIAPNFDIVSVIDNNKKVCKMFNKEFGLNVMHFKEGKK